MKKVLLISVLLFPILGIAEQNNVKVLEKQVKELKLWKIQAEQRISSLEKLLIKDSPKKSKLKSTKVSSDIVEIIVTNKRFQDKDTSRGIYQQAIWWDAEYKAENLKKPARAIKGVIEFADLFGEVHFRLRSTINEPISINKSVKEEGTGFKYNQFMSNHAWMRTTDLKDMKVTFKVRSIIYEDGTTENISN
ncbi:hypothetical protein MNB_SM-4-1698 [hydrothermal vent metagenome]|uniref:Uncharacterized protein n=1 Tax=hydrothermal vent metagenome TaxID=652676 RepID=A0A1W1BLV0_9ZZZZ